MWSNISAEYFDVCQQLANKLKGEFIGEEEYEISYHVFCARFVVWISYEISFCGVNKIVDTIKRMSVAYEIDKFGWKTDPVVKRFITDYLDDDFSNLYTVIFYRKSFYFSK